MLFLRSNDKDRDQLSTINSKISFPQHKEDLRRAFVKTFFFVLEGKLDKKFNIL